MTALWSEGGIIDRVDKEISQYMFRLELPSVLETVLTLPGTTFGAGNLSIGFLPLFVGM